MRWVQDDGGRAAAGYRGSAGDCVCRAVAIAEERPYREVYDELWTAANAAPVRKRARKTSSPRDGFDFRTLRRYLIARGWTWTPTMAIGSGTTVHLRDGELPGGRLIVSVSKHVVAVVDGVVRDTYDPTRDGTRCVYGFFRKEN